MRKPSVAFPRSFLLPSLKAEFLMKLNGTVCLAFRNLLICMPSVFRDTPRFGFARGMRSRYALPGEVQYGPVYLSLPVRQVKRGAQFDYNGGKTELSSREKTNISSSVNGVYSTGTR